MPRQKTGLARPNKIQVCLSDEELASLAEALGRARAHPEQRKISSARWRISPSRLLGALALGVIHSDSAVAAAARAHAADRTDHRGKGPAA